MNIVETYNDIHMISMRSQITLKLLGYFFVNPGQKKYVNELARDLQIDLGNLFRKLKELENEGILSSEVKGRERYYFLNNNYPLDEFKKIYNRSYGLDKLIASTFKDLKGIKEIYLFGSFAKGGFGRESDVDILLVGSHSSISAQKAILKLQNNLGREFNIVNMDEKEFTKRKKDKDPFISNVLSGKFIKII